MSVKPADEKFVIDYKLLKGLIRSACIDDNNEPLKFNINPKKLETELDNNDMNLVLVPNGFYSKYVNKDSIVLISEQYRGDRLTWFDSHKQYTSLIFLRKDRYDKEARYMVEELLHDKEDKVSLLADLLGRYPCFVATIVAYKGNNPDHFGRNSYTINIRANMIQRQDEQYNYNNDDIKEG